MRVFVNVSERINLPAGKVKILGASWVEKNLGGNYYFAQGLVRAAGKSEKNNYLLVRSPRGVSLPELFIKNNKDGLKSMSA